MTDRSRVEQRDDLMTALGMLVDPIRRLIASVDEQRPQIPYLESQFHSDLRAFRPMVDAFCRSGNHIFRHERTRILNPVTELISMISSCRHAEMNIDHTRRMVDQPLNTIKAAIRAVPCDDPGTILPSE